MPEDDVNTANGPGTAESPDPRPAPAQGRSAEPQSLTFWLGIIALIISLLAAGAAVFAWYQVAVTGRLEVGAQKSIVDRVASEFEDIKQAQDKHQARVDTLKQAFSSLQTDITEALRQESRTREETFQRFRVEFDALSKSVQRVHDDLGRSVDTWMLEEAEQLLLLANQRLSLVEDTRLAESALALADEKLEEIGDPGLLPVRRKIAEELAALAALPKIDVAGIAIRIGTLMEQIDQLPLSEDMQRPEWLTGESAPSEPTAAEGGDLKAIGRQILQDLSGLVHIRRVDETKLPKLKPVQRFLINENVRMLLASAQYALLRGNAALYSKNIADSGHWLQRYFDGHDDTVQRFEAEIDALGKIVLTRDIPDINGSLELLRQRISGPAQ